MYFLIYCILQYVYEGKATPLAELLLFCLHVECMCCTLTLHTFNMVVNKSHFRQGCRLAFISIYIYNIQLVIMGNKKIKFCHNSSVSPKNTTICLQHSHLKIKLNSRQKQLQIIQFPSFPLNNVQTHGTLKFNHFFQKIHCIYWFVHCIINFHSLQTICHSLLFIHFFRHEGIHLDGSFTIDLYYWIISYTIRLFI